eukprot:TRINITY_DN21407_c0_g1_i1.p1 TRINITY_DN21407_c0_g1~~TRINITY_DN21407_c0_g1_i1.p1  ORF type:complete len:778 (+),score=170.03 TRINITY_DN21407_c0_g1_i1:241-2334(+)
MSGGGVLSPAEDPFVRTISTMHLRKKLHQIGSQVIQRSKAAGTGANQQVEDASPYQHHMWGQAHLNMRIPLSEQQQPWRDFYLMLEMTSADANFWIDIIERADRHKAGHEDGVADGAFHWGDFQVDVEATPGTVPGKKAGMDVNTALDALYDLTPLRIEQIFTRFSKTNGGLSGVLTLGELGQALRHQGLHKTEPLLKEIQRAVDCNASGKLYLPEFAVALTRLKLADLCVKMPREMADLHVLDYCAEDVIHRPFVSDWRKFVFGHRPPGYMRWIHMKGVDKQLLLPIAVKYHLHPLGIEDAMSLSAQQSKLDRYGPHYFLVLSFYRLRHDGMSTFKNKVQVCRQNCAFFISGPPRWDTCITIIENSSERVRAFGSSGMSDSDEDSETSPERAAEPPPRMLRRPTVVPGARKKSFMAPRRRSLRRGDMWECLRSKIQESHVRVREKAVDFLIHEMLAMAIDELMPIIAAYRARLDLWYRTMSLEKDAISPSFLKEISAITLELKELLRVIRPMRHILRQFCEDSAISSDCKMYLEDSRVRLEHIVEDIVSLSDMCKTLQDEHRHHSDRKLNNTLFLLTVATAIFMPAQFFAGVYGMNFVDDDGKPTIPELISPYGYAIFMACSAVWFVVAGGAAWLHVRGGSEIIIGNEQTEATANADSERNKTSRQSNKVETRKESRISDGTDSRSSFDQSASSQA